MGRIPPERNAKANMSPIRKKRTLEVFKTGDEKHLWRIAKDLFETGFFNCYLTPQQFNLLRILLYYGGENKEDNPAWSFFMNGSLLLRFKEDAGDDSNSNENMYIKPGYPTLRNLNATIRYLLYEKAVDYYFFQNLNEVKEFQLLDNVANDDYPSVTSGDNSAEKSSKNDNDQDERKSTSRNDDDEDDNYDDDEDDDYDNEEESDKKGGDQEASDATKIYQTVNEESKLDSIKTDDGLLVDDLTKDYVLLVSKEELMKKPSYPSVPELSADEDAIGKMVHPILGTSSAIESSIEKQNELKLIKNFNKIYHSFENDLPNIHKKRKLERSDKQLEMAGDISQKNEPGDSDSKQVNKLMTLGGYEFISEKLVE